MKELSSLFKQYKICPKDSGLYLLALTHSSYNAETHTKHVDYERLEYIGDAVLGFVSATLIFKHHPEMDQGLMSKLRSYLVQSKSLANYARKAHLIEYIRVGHSIDQKQLDKSDKILEDVFESFIGAIYLDQGIKVAEKFIKSFIEDDVINANIDDLTDYKTRLQEEMQAEHRDSVKYKLIKRSGPPHNPIFVVEVTFNDVILAQGQGKSMKKAEQEAAKNALNKKAVI